MTTIDSALLALGWRAAQTESLAGAPGCGEPGRVVRGGRLLLVRTGHGDCVADYGALLKSVDTGVGSPVCGDWVLVERHRDSGGGSARGVIRFVLHRNNVLVRKRPGSPKAQPIVANLDAVWVMVGMDRDQGLRSLERYRTLVTDARISPLILLNKADLTVDVAAQVAVAASRAPGLDTVVLSARNGTGLDRLRATLSAGSSVALIGPSGVGKSTLINALAPQNREPTREVRGGDHRGRHTTSATHMEATPEGALLIDTPGLKDLSVCGMQDEVGRSFTDLTDLARSCRFRDCRHDREPGCAVRAALEDERLSSERFLRYLALRRDAAAGRARH